MGDREYKKSRSLEYLVEFAKKNLDLMEDKSLAQALADATGATVYAYYRRTSYGDTLLTKNERDKIEAYAKLSKEEKKSVKLTYEETKLYEIWCTNKYAWSKFSYFYTNLIL